MKSSLKQSTEERRALLLIALCWLVYATSYIGRGNYAANINLVMDYYSINHADAGLVSTGFFFAYGIGQVVNGLFCKKYNIKWIIFACLLISGTVNLAVSLTPSFAPIKYLWMLNGFALSVLWPTLIRLLSESISSEYMARATIIMGTTIAVGTFFVYGSSALFSLFTDYKASFYTSSAMLFAVAIIWILSYSSLKCECADLTQTKSEKTTKADGSIAGGIILIVCILSLFGIITNLIKDGLTTWVPSILKESFDLGDSLSIFLTLALPIVSIFGNGLAVAMHKRIPDYVYKGALMLLTSGVITIAIILGFKINSIYVTFIGFIAVSLIVSACNSLITSVFPLFMRGKVNSGFIAGILNGFCYVGSTLSSFGLGYIADVGGWMSVFITLLIAVAIALVGTLVYEILKRKLEFKQ